MNLCFVKRLMLPALVMIPYKFSYTLIIFLVGFNLIDFLLLGKSNNSKTKNYIYLLLELTCFGLLGGFVITDFGNNSSSQSTAISIFATIMLIIYIIIFVVEIALAVKRRFKGAKVSNEAEWELKGELSEKHSSLRDQDTISDMHNNHREEIKVVAV